MKRVHGTMQGLAKIMAVLGGAVLLALIVMTCLSVVGRAVNTGLHALLDAGMLGQVAQGLINSGIGAIRGDFELVEAGMAFCIFAFLPWCQISGGHAVVEILTNRLPGPANKAVIFLSEVLFAVALVVIARQLELGFERKLRSGQTTALLQMPIWWAYGACLVGAGLAAMMSIYVALLRGAALFGVPVPLTHSHTRAETLS
jgi:TRAP-type C4-dicarboxylate transport system permease small subunit